MNLFSPVNDSLMLTERVAAQIKKAIDAGQYCPGDKLPSENQLAELFQVSRTSIREAVKVLAGQGLVEVKRGIGAFVTAATPDDHLTKLEDVIYRQKDQLLELFQIRRILEEEVAAQAVRKATGEDIDKLSKLIEAAEETAARNSETKIGELHAINSNFHCTLLEITGNNTLKQIMNSLIDALDGSRRITLQLPGRHTISVAGHRVILDAIKEGDENKAREAMRDHLRGVEENIKRMIEHKTDHKN